MVKAKYKENDKKGMCECGHNHIQYVGNLGKYSDEEGYDLIESCCYCNCEKFKRVKMNADELIKECEGLTESDLNEIQLRTSRQIKEICEEMKGGLKKDE